MHRFHFHSAIRAKLLRMFVVTLIGCAIAPDTVLAQGGPPAPPVGVSPPLARKVTQWDEYTGRFEPIASVDVRARVSGFIEAIHFTDGQMIHAGEPLFTIDPRPYQIAVDQARSEILRARAQVTVTAADFERAESLVRSAAGTVRDLDQRRANLDTARAQLLSAEASLRNAELNLEWTLVRAPLTGRISDRRVDVGNLITGGQSNSSLLTTIVSLEPIHFVFDASEADYIRYARQSASGTRSSGRETGHPVQIRLADERDWTRTGRLDFVDNQMSARSGTIRARAVLPNPGQFLTPGTFGRLRLFGGEIDALLVPDAAIVSDQARKIVLTVGADNKVVPKPVTLGALALGLRVITSGLAPDDRVVVNGLANPFVRPGAAVTPQPAEIKPDEPPAANGRAARP